MERHPRRTEPRSPAGPVPHSEAPAASATARGPDARGAAADDGVARGEPTRAARGVALEAAAQPRLFGAHADALDDAPEPALEGRPLRWRSLLVGASPREILARIVPEDPLGVRAIVAARLCAQALLLDADRVHLRSLALCARWAPRYQGQPELHTWLERLVDQAASELLREEQEELAHEPASPAGAFAALARPLELDARALQLCCRSFNRLPLEDRRAFFEFVVRGRSLDELARASGQSAVELARRARRALDLFTPLALGPADGGAGPARRGSEVRT